MAMDMMGSSGAPFPPISNYKGVMLCDRPSADIGPKKPAPFNSAVVPPEQLGLAPTKKMNVHSTAIKPKDTDSVLYKHKQYLASLKKEIKSQKEQEAGMEEAEEAKRKRFVERSAQLRDAIRAGLLASTELMGDEPRGTSPPAEAPAAPAAEPEREPEVEPELKPVIPSLKLPSTGAHPGSELLGKPAWALTEEQVEAKDELQEEIDVDDLLDFVEDLDFEQYVDDLEVQQALEIMRSRVTMINTQRSEREIPEGSEKPAVLRPVAEAEADDGEEWNQSIAEDPTDEGRAVAVKAAKELLGSSRKLRAVHSTASIAKRLEALKEEEVAAAQALAEQAERPKKEVDPSNLPYLYRNPAV
jgi:hypothetical protein